MLELGDASADCHREIGEAAAAAKLDLLLAVGAESATLAEGARAAGLEHVLTFPDATSAAAELPGLVDDGDLVLVKGSRGVQLERAIEALLAHRAPEARA